MGFPAQNLKIHLPQQKKKKILLGKTKCDHHVTLLSCLFHSMWNSVNQLLPQEFIPQTQTSPSFACSVVLRY